MSDLFDERLRNAARSAPTPQPPQDLIGRVLTERATGARIILPTKSAGPRRLHGRLWVAVLLAATLAVAAVLSIPSTIHHVDLPATDLGSAGDGLFVSTAYAEQPPTVPLAPSLRGVDGSRLGPRSYEYRIQYVDSAGRVIPDGAGLVDVADAGVINGVAAWRVVLSAEQTEDGQRRAASETLFVARGTLEPLSRVVHVRPFSRFSSINIVQRFTADSVLGQMTTDSGVKRPIARRLPVQFGPFLSDAIAPLALAGVHLSRNWSAGVSILGWAVVSRDVFYPATLRVIGEERISTPRGVFDCWKLAVAAGRQRRIEWVRKSDGLGLRSYDEAPTPKGHRQFVLLNP
jgi:hypothetical protein